MEHFKELLITLQTLDIRITSFRKVRNGQPQDIKLYDLRHENPLLNADYKRRVKRLQQLAFVDIMNLGREQISFQMQGLDHLRQVFQKFWDRYYHSPVPIGSEHDLEMVLSLKLSEIFICPFLSFQDHAQANDDFLDDLETSVRFRQTVAEEFGKAVAKALAPHEKQPMELPTPKHRATPTFKERVKTDFFNLINEYFSHGEREELKALLDTTSLPGGPLVFNGAGNQLADAFKQLFDANLIVGCNKAELESWIQQHFKYRDKGEVKSYTGKYLQDMISSNTKACQSPLFDVRKVGDEFTISPLIRNNKNRKK